MNSAVQKWGDNSRVWDRGDNSLYISIYIYYVYTEFDIYTKSYGCKLHFLYETDVASGCFTEHTHLSYSPLRTHLNSSKTKDGTVHYRISWVNELKRK